MKQHMKSCRMIEKETIITSKILTCPSKSKVQLNKKVQSKKVQSKPNR